jgi:hypothetical protein
MAKRKQMAMQPMVVDCQEPMSSFSQKHDQETLNYKERHDRVQGRQAAKLKAQEYKGRY